MPQAPYHSFWKSIYHIPSLQSLLWHNTRTHWNFSGHLSSILYLFGELAVESHGLYQCSLSSEVWCIGSATTCRYFWITWVQAHSVEIHSLTDGNIASRSYPSTHLYFHFARILLCDSRWTPVISWKYYILTQSVTDIAVDGKWLVVNTEQGYSNLLQAGHWHCCPKKTFHTHRLARLSD